MSIILLLLLAFFGGIPGPYNDVGLDDKQLKQANVIVNRYTKLEEQIKSKDELSRQNVLQNIRTRRDHELDALLNADQKSQLLILRKQMAEGIPMGGGLFRSYDIDNYFIPSDNGGVRVMGLDEAYQDAVQNASKQPDGIKFTVTNRNGKAYKAVVLLIEGFDGRGVRVSSERASISNLKDGEVQEVKQIVENRREIKNFEITLIEPAVTPK